MASLRSADYLVRQLIQLEFREHNIRKIIDMIYLFSFALALGLGAGVIGIFLGWLLLFEVPMKVIQ
jgi:hypothetical protein